MKEIVNKIGLSNSSFVRKKIIDDLTNQGLLIIKETKKEKKYKTNHELVVKL